MMKIGPLALAALATVLAGLPSLGCTPEAEAQTRSVAASWVLPTRNEDGSALPVSQIQRTCIVVALTASGAAIQPETCFNAPATTGIVPVPLSPACGTFYFRASVDATNGQRSAPSAPETKVYPCAPNAPTGLTVL